MNTTATSSTNSTREVQPHIVSYWYFRTSLAVWFVTPLLYMPVAITSEAVGFLFCNCNIHLPFHGPLFKERYPFFLPIYLLMRLVMCYFVSVIQIYVIVPVSDIFWGVKNLFCHQSYKENKIDAVIHASWPGLKLYEQLGEAVPQFVIAVIFYYKNYDWLGSSELIFGIVTMTLSLGSIIIGIGNGIRYYNAGPLLSNVRPKEIYRVKKMQQMYRF